MNPARIYGRGFALPLDEFIPAGTNLSAVGHMGLFP
jgi:hypothetical protein